MLGRLQDRYYFCFLGDKNINHHRANSTYLFYQQPVSLLYNYNSDCKISHSLSEYIPNLHTRLCIDKYKPTDRLLELVDVHDLSILQLQSLLHKKDLAIYLVRSYSYKI